MSTQTHTPASTPLWKQLLGACAGAAVAVVVYEGFLFVTPHLEAWVTLPTAPGVTHQDETNLNTVNDIDAARQAARNREIADRFAAASSSDVPAVHAAAVPSSSSSSSANSSSVGGLRAVGEAAKAILGTGSSSSMRTSSVASSKSSTSSSAKSSERSVPVVTKAVPAVPHADSLPKSGVGVMMAAAAAFGASSERLRQRRNARAKQAA